MKSRQQRLKAIELTLTPQQIVLVWLGRAQKGGRFVEGGLQSQSPREYVANAVSDAIRSSMKGNREPVIEQAIQQARQEADLLYLLVIEANGSILGGSYQSRQSLLLVNGHLQAVGCVLGHGIEDAGLIARLRSSLTLVVEDLLISEEACSRTSSERLEGQDVLFPDVRKDLNERIEAAKMLSDCFSRMATESGEVEIDWEQIRTSLEPVVDRQVAGWVNLARMSMLLALGKAEAWREPVDRLLNAT